MADFFEDLTGSAGGYMGQVGGYDIGPQVAPTVSASPEFTGSAVQYAPELTYQTPSYMPTFDFQSFFPQTSYAPTYTAEQAQQNIFAGPGATPVTPQLQSLYGQAAQPFPSVIGQFAGPQGAQLASGLYDTTGISGAVPETPVAPQQDKAGFFQSLLGKGFSTADALKLALGIGGGILGMQAQSRAAEDAAAARREYTDAAKAAAGEYKTLAQPYLTAGGSALSQALQGSFSPASAQQFQAAQAQIAQGAERTGGVGSIQSAAALQNMRQQILDAQTKTALALLGPGNTLASNAILTDLQGTQGGIKMELDIATQAANASARMYQSIASALGYGGGPSQTQQQQQQPVVS
jgi:hypothetical protein